MQKNKRVAIFIPNLNSNGTVKIGLSQAEILQKAGHLPTLFVIRGDGDFLPPEGIPIHYLYSVDQSLKSIRQIQMDMQNLVREIEAKYGKFNLYFSNTTRCDQVLTGCNFSPAYYFCHCALGKELLNELRRGPLKFWKRWKQAQALVGKNIITVSKGIQQELSKLRWLKPQSLQTIYNPFLIDDIRQKSEEIPAELPNEPYMIHVGRFTRQKRHDILFKALKLMPDAPKLVLLCNKPEKIQKLAKRMGVADRIITPGFQHNPYAWIAKAELMLLSSDYEGLPTVLIESLICGTPVVSTDCPHGPSEILTDELTKYLVPCRQPDKLALIAQQCLAEKPDVRSATILMQVQASYIAQQYLSLCE